MLTSASIMLSSLQLIIYYSLIIVNSIENIDSVRHHQMSDNILSTKYNDTYLFNRRSTDLATSSPVSLDAPLPNYNRTKLDGRLRYLEALLFVENEIVRILEYNNNFHRTKREVVKLITTANLYFYQLNLRLMIVDIIRLDVTGMDVNAFGEYRLRQLKILPKHDFALIFRQNMPGGEAFVGGMCNRYPVALCGFYASNPTNMAAIVFHETAHLLRVAHEPTQMPILVANCDCSQQEINDRKCLQIPGFDHSCTVQQLVNLLPSVYCIDQLPDYLPSTVVSICGNGIREGDEQCDCGPTHDDCRNQWNCRYDSCTQIVPSIIIVMTIISTIFGLIIISIMIIARCNYFNIINSAASCRFAKFIYRITFVKSSPMNTIPPLLTRKQLKKVPIEFIVPSNPSSSITNATHNCNRKYNDNINLNKKYVLVKKFNEDVPLLVQSLLPKHHKNENISTLNSNASSSVIINMDTIEKDNVNKNVDDLIRLFEQKR